MLPAVDVGRWARSTCSCGCGGCGCSGGSRGGGDDGGVVGPGGRGGGGGRGVGRVPVVADGADVVGVPDGGAGRAAHGVRGAADDRRGVLAVSGRTAARRRAGRRCWCCWRSAAARVRRSGRRPAGTASTTTGTGGWIWPIPAAGIPRRLGAVRGAGRRRGRGGGGRGRRRGRRRGGRRGAGRRRRGGRRGGRRRRRRGGRRGRGRGALHDRLLDGVGVRGRHGGVGLRHGGRTCRELRRRVRLHGRCLYGRRLHARGGAGRHELRGPGRRRMGLAGGAVHGGGSRRRRGRGFGAAVALARRGRRRGRPTWLIGAPRDGRARGARAAVFRHGGVVHGVLDQPARAARGLGTAVAAAADIDGDTLGEWHGRGRRGPRWLAGPAVGRRIIQLPGRRCRTRG
ncbi:MAG: hypothetical protein MZV63_56440 [Marinilabiliales bacterium]|nr:hypothetical protein [Marinilabiliales bacterium]